MWQEYFFPIAHLYVFQGKIKLLGKSFWFSLLCNVYLPFLFGGDERQESMKKKFQSLTNVEYFSSSLGVKLNEASNCVILPHQWLQLYVDCAQNLLGIQNVVSDRNSKYVN